MCIRSYGHYVLENLKIMLNMYNNIQTEVHICWAGQFNATLEQINLKTYPGFNT